ncbi:MAG: Maf family nucleotide pyrophosphatase [Betaproteobacteria bacterium]
MTTTPLILASSSIYRRELLSRLGLTFSSVSPHIDESALPGEIPQATALRLALAKAQAVAQTHNTGLVIGSDQVADLEGLALGKPLTHENARLQLKAMSGKTVYFHTALCLFNIQTGRYQLETVSPKVQFRTLSSENIENYLFKEKPYDCAGSAKIESLGIALVHGVDCADPTALIGLPLICLISMLKKEGMPVL